MQLLTDIIDKIQGKLPLKLRRSSQWKDVRNKFINEYNVCAVCGGKDNLEVHHIIPFHIAPELELDEDNLITLCERKKYGINCHLFIGHLGNYKRYNPDVIFDSIYWYRKLSNK